MKISENLSRFFQGTALVLALTFLVVGYTPSINFGAVKNPSYGLVNAVELDPGTGAPVPVDYDGDGLFGDDDGCPNTYGTSSKTPYSDGCPDSDGDGYADKGADWLARYNDICPNNSDHEQCLKLLGLATYPTDYDLMMCRDLQQYENDLITARFLAVGAAGLAALLLLLIPGTQVVGIKILIAAVSLTGVVAGTLYASDASNALGNVQSVRAQLQGLGRCP